ncbi:carboxymuconolactone decarboxylase family protein [Staphylococcus sp. IVB6181]|uniref:carboxymuconolactone decarboxylase family protein n=1 Tax=Staphylococcus TaxID=1279 RepID=UPI000D030345|nr:MULTISPECIES: carboxymuconolactone decarboxylase family protein [Staphylococcus]MCD8915280.1 carboxymuconolactone decarboxylase family protein [Staphylococcus simulans]UXV34943.1 carboxymuconolactone decarboxylase family protein [Staphylococcus sp. IVB6181]
MDNRIDYGTVAKEKIDILLEMEKQLKKADIDRKLREMIKVRASQINGCAYCLGIHTSDARKVGVSEEELFLLSAWEDTNLYSEKTKLALELTEAITQIAQGGVPDELYERVRKEYSEEAYTDLVFTINQINFWNRLSISMGNQHIV